MRLNVLSLAAIAWVVIAFPATAESMKSTEADALSKLFKKLDKNHDGKLDANELQAFIFNKADKNHDGIVDEDEIGAAEAREVIQIKAF